MLNIVGRVASSFAPFSSRLWWSFGAGFALYQFIPYTMKKTKDAWTPQIRERIEVASVGLGFLSGMLLSINPFTNLYFTLDYAANNETFLNVASENISKVWFATNKNEAKVMVNRAKYLAAALAVVTNAGDVISTVHLGIAGVAYGAKFASTNFLIPAAKASATALAPALKAAGAYILPALKAKCFSILTTGTIPAVGLAVIYFALPVALIYYSTSVVNSAEKWEFEIDYMRVIKQVGPLTVEEQKVVTEIKNEYDRLKNIVRKSSMHDYFMREVYDNSEESQKFCNDYRNLRARVDNELRTKEFVNGDKIFSEIDNLLQYVRLSTTFTATASLVCLLTPAPIALASLAVGVMSLGCLMETSRRYNDRVQSLVNPPAPAKAK